MLKSRSECEEVIGGGQARVECITQDTGSSKLSVQTDTSGHRYFMAGESDTVSRVVYLSRLSRTRPRTGHQPHDHSRH